MEPLFAEWMKSVEESILRLVKDKGSGSPEEIASILGISEKNATTFLCRMVEEGALKITGVEVKQYREVKGESHEQPRPLRCGGNNGWSRIL
jgi:predicted HTH transcriptional regulator